MLHSIHSLIGFTMGATDGEIGKVKDFYFDDTNWNIRYLIVDTGNWLFGRKVLISPVALQVPDWNARKFPVNLTKDQVKHSPDINTEKPISRMQEDELYRHYSWPYNEGSGLGFLTTGMVGGVVSPGTPFEESIMHEVHKDDPQSTEKTSSGQNVNPHLRSYKTITAYTVHSDHEIGTAEDFLMNDTNWTISYMVVETGNWYSGKKVLLPIDTINKIEWSFSSIHLEPNSEKLKSLPEFDYSQPIDEDKIQRWFNNTGETYRNSAGG